MSSTADKIGNDLLVGWDSTEVDSDCDRDVEDIITTNDKGILEKQKQQEEHSNNSQKTNDLVNDPFSSSALGRGGGRGRGGGIDGTTTCTKDDMNMTQVQEEDEEEETSFFNSTRSSSQQMQQKQPFNLEFDDDQIITREEIFGNKQQQKQGKGMQSGLYSNDGYLNDEGEHEINMLSETLQQNQSLTGSSSPSNDDKMAGDIHTAGATNTNTNSHSTTAPRLWSRFAPFGMRQQQPPQQQQQTQDDSDEGLLVNKDNNDQTTRSSLETMNDEKHDKQMKHESDHSSSSSSSSSTFMAPGDIHHTTPATTTTSTSKSNNPSSPSPSSSPQRPMMKNAIEGFGSHTHSNNNNPPQSNEIKTQQSSKPSSSFTGISGFFRSIQIQRLKSKQQFDPFSLTQEELDILKEDICSRYDDLQAMETVNSSSKTNSSRDNTNTKTVATTNLVNTNQPGITDSIKAAILAPEAFSEYVDRLVEEENGYDDMGVYRTVPLGGDKDIVDDYTLRRKEMKPMKISGEEDKPMTWSEVAEALNENMVIDEESFLEDLDPLGSYRRVLPMKADDDDDDDDDAVVEKGYETRREMEELRMQVMRLNGRIESLEEQLKSKDDEIETWKEKVRILEEKQQTINANHTATSSGGDNATGKGDDNLIELSDIIKEEKSSNEEKIKYKENFFEM